MRDEKYYHYERRWLNKKHGRAHSIAVVEVDEFDKAKNPYSSSFVNVSLSLGDCHDDISLDFSYDIEQGDLQKQLDKVDALVQTLTTLRTKMISAAPVAKKHFEDYKAYCKRKK